MPKDNIERAIKKAAGGDAENYEAIRYEGYGPGGVAIIVEALTDNRNRTGGAVRSCFTKYGGSLGETGSVALHVRPRRRDRLSGVAPASPTRCWRRRSRPAPTTSQRDEDGHVVTCAFESLGEVAAALEAKLGEAETRQGACGSRRPTTAVDEEKAASMLKLIAALEDDDDVQNVYSNFEVSDEVLEKLTAA